MNTCDTSINISTLDDMFNVINEWFYKNTLRKPNILIGVIHGRKNSRVAYDVFNTPNERKNTEFVINGNIMHDAEKVYLEMLRSCYILYCHQNKIRITSRGGSGGKYDKKDMNKWWYGNGYYGKKEYLTYSFNKGIIVEHRNKANGYEIVGISDEGKKLFNTHNWFLTLERDKYTYGKYTHGAHIARKNICPLCGNINRDTKKSAEFLCFNCFREIFKDSPSIIQKAMQCKMVSD